jgi:hypothetical protein
MHREFWSRNLFKYSNSYNREGDGRITSGCIFMSSGIWHHVEEPFREDRGNVVLQNVSKHLPGYTESHLRRHLHNHHHGHLKPHASIDLKLQKCARMERGGSHVQ